MTDDAESRVDAGAAEAQASAGTSEDASDSSAPVDFGDLSLPQRIFVAAVQNPARGVVIVGLFAFAFSFYIAFWMAFPRVAAFMSGIGLVIAGIIAAVYLLSGRLSR